MEKLLENLSVGELRENAHEPGFVQGAMIARRLHGFLQPVPLLGVFNMGELDADGPAIGAGKMVDDLPKRSFVRQARQTLGGKRAIEVVRSQAEVGEVEFGLRRGAFAEGVQVGEEVAPDAVGIDQLVNPALGLDRFEERVFRQRFGRKVSQARSGGGAIAMAVGVPVGMTVGFCLTFRFRHRRPRRRERSETRRAREECSPDFRDRGGVLKVLSVKVLDVARVDAEFAEHGFRWSGYEVDVLREEQQSAGGPDARFLRVVVFSGNGAANLSLFRRHFAHDGA